MDLKFYEKALREAERELDAAATRSAERCREEGDPAKAELKRLQAEVSA